MASPNKNLSRGLHRRMTPMKISLHYLTGIVTGILSSLLAMAITEGTSAFLPIVIMGGFVSVAVLLIHLSSRMTEAFDLLAVRVKYFNIDPNNKGISKAYREYRRRIDAAEEKISIINSPTLGPGPGRGSGPLTESKEKELDKYYKSLEGAIKDRGVEYQRLVQIEAGRKIKHGERNELISEHLRHIISQVESSRYGVFVSRDKTVLPYALMVIDSRFLLWQIEEYVGSDRRIQFRGLLVLEDLRGRIVERIDEIIDAAIKNNSAMSVDDPLLQTTA